MNLLHSTTVVVFGPDYFENSEVGLCNGLQAEDKEVAESYRGFGYWDNFEHKIIGVDIPCFQLVRQMESSQVQNYYGLLDPDTYPALKILHFHLNIPSLGDYC